MLGRNAAYVQQFIKRGVPRRLSEEDRRTLARYFSVPDSELGGPSAEERVSEIGLISVPRLDIGAAAGAGTLPGEERVGAHFAFDAKWLRQLGASDPQRLSIIRVQGDSMSPTLADGDEILVDTSEAARKLRDGIYVLRFEDALMVKRLAPNPASRRLSITSDNDAYPSWPECDPAAIDVIGRVIWSGRRIG